MKNSLLAFFFLFREICKPILRLLFQYNSIQYRSYHAVISSSTCTGGSLYSTVGSPVENTGGLWYLNTALPTTCSGSINRYILDYTPNTNGISAAVAMFQLDAGNIYTKVD